MLARATRWIAARSDRVTLMARRPEALARDLGAEACSLDWADPGAASAMAQLPGDFDLAVIWLHDAAAHLARPAEDRLCPGGRVCRVHGARSADPKVRTAREPDPRPGLDRQVVILGWHPDPVGEDGKRWLSDAEISGGVIAALRDPALEALTIGGASG